jgi:hypothetical protein
MNSNTKLPKDLRKKQAPLCAVRELLGLPSKWKKPVLMHRIDVNPLDNER